MRQQYILSSQFQINCYINLAISLQDLGGRASQEYTIWMLDVDERLASSSHVPSSLIPTKQI